MNRPDSILNDVPPVTLFGRIDRASWGWLHLEGRERCPFLAGYLPSLPRESFHPSIATSSGRAALEAGFQTYKIIKRELRKHGRPLQPADAVLDFGCGWGRITRYFTRDVQPENLWGIDISETAIEACRETNRWARFEQNSPLPPAPFEDETFDLIYAYAVFSHLSEASHLAWLQEFERVLKPGGRLAIGHRSRRCCRRVATSRRSNLAFTPGRQKSGRILRPTTRTGSGVAAHSPRHIRLGNRRPASCRRAAWNTARICASVLLRRRLF